MGVLKEDFSENSENREKLFDRNITSNKKGGKNGATKNLTYDEHLDKLNKFIDSTVKRKENIFDEFAKKDISKKVEKPKILKNTFKRNNKGDLDEETLKDTTLRDDAEEFEEYHKKIKKMREK